MFMYGVDYRRASSIADAVDLIRANPDAKFLAGGQSLVAAMKLRLSAPSMLIDLGGLNELTSIAVDRKYVTLGAMVRHAEVAQSTEIKSAIPALSSLAKGIGDHMVRNMGTIGGSVSNNDPAADYPAALMGLDAIIQTSERSVPVDDFFLGMYETALAPDELLTSIKLRIPLRAKYMKFKNPASRFAMVGVLVAQYEDSVRVAVTGAAPAVFRAAEMEDALTKTFHENSLADIHISPDVLSSDMHAQADYRAHLIGILTRRAVQEMTAS